MGYNYGYDVITSDLRMTVSKDNILRIESFDRHVVTLYLPAKTNLPTHTATCNFKKLFFQNSSAIELVNFQGHVNKGNHYQNSSVSFTPYATSSPHSRKWLGPPVHTSNFYGRYIATPALLNPVK